MWKDYCRWSLHCVVCPGTSEDGLGAITNKHCYAGHQPLLQPDRPSVVCARLPRYRLAGLHWEVSTALRAQAGNGHSERAGFLAKCTNESLANDRIIVFSFPKFSFYWPRQRCQGTYTSLWTAIAGHVERMNTSIHVRLCRRHAVPMSRMRCWMTGRLLRSMACGQLTHHTCIPARDITREVHVVMVPAD